MTDYQTESGIVVPSYTRENAQIDPPLDYAGYRSTEFRHPKNPLVLRKIRRASKQIPMPILAQDNADSMYQLARSVLKGVPSG